MAATSETTDNAGSVAAAELLPYHPDRLDLYLARQAQVGGWAYFAILFVLASSVAALPLIAVPVSVRSQGVIRSALDSQVLVAPIGGEVVYVIPRGHRRVAAGDTVLLLHRADLEAREHVLTARAETMQEEARDLGQLISWADGNHFQPSATSLRYRTALASTVQELTAAAARLRSAERDAARSATLYERQLVSAADAAALQDLVAREREDSVLLRTRTAARWRGELAALNESMRNLRTEQAALREQLDQLLVQAPVAGWLDRIAGLSPASQVPAGERIATLTPVSPLVAELYVDPRAVDGIRPGGRVRLQLQSRQYSRDGAWDGVVVEISPVLVPAGDGAVALVRVAPEPASTGAGAAAVPLRRGSAVVGRFQIGKRTLWALLRGRRDTRDRGVPAPQPPDEGSRD